MQLTDLLDRFADTEPEGDGWLATCPAHSDHKPSLRIAVGKAGILIKCRAGCATADVLEAVGLTMRDLFNVEGTDDAPRARSTGAPAGPADIAALRVRLDEWSARLTAQPDTDGDSSGSDALAYAERRFGLTLADCQRLGLGVATDLGGGPRLVVPFYDERGVARGYQARALAADPRVRWLGPPNPDGASWSATGVLRGDGGRDEVLVCEGPGDGLTACAAGYDAVFVRGAALADRDDVVQAVAAFAGDRPVVVYGDNDDSGQRFARTLVGRLAAEGIIAAAAQPEQGNDLTEWRERAADGFVAALVIRTRDTIQMAPDAIAARLDALAPEDLTDLGMAQRLLDRIAANTSDVRYSPEGGFYLLDGGVWRPDQLNTVRTRAQASAKALWRDCDAIEAEVDLLPDGTPQKRTYTRRLGRMRQFAKHANSTRGIDSMVKEVQALPGVAVSLTDFDSHPHLMAARNGVIDLRTGDLLPHDPLLLLTRRVDLDYRPGAPADRWRQFLAEVFPTEPELPGYMQRLVGYGITGNTDEQCFAVLYGTGANGKSVFTDTLTEVFRDFAVTTPFSTFEQKPSGGIPNDLAALRGARLVMAAEGERNAPMAEAVLKRITGHDLISARFMRQEFFEFRPSFLLLLATNYPPKFYGQDEGLWRRVKFLKWERFFSAAERDHRLGEELLTEAEGILAWAVEGAVEWYARGLGDPEVIVRETAQYRATSDALSGFYPGVYEPDPDGGTALGATVFDAYLKWCDDEHLPLKEVWTRRTFFAAMEERGVAKRKGKHGVVLVGLKKSPPERADDAGLTNYPSMELTTGGI